MKLKITNGTDSVSLITGAKNGFDLIAFEPASPTAVETWNVNPLAEGKILVESHKESVIDVLSVAAAFDGQDQLAAEKIMLTRLLEQAQEYWMSLWSTSPVWLEAQGTCETNTRYAVIYAYRIAGDANPYDPETDAEGTLEITLEHMVWQSHAPGTAPCLNIHNAEEKQASAWAGSVEYSATYDADLWLATVVKGAATRYIQKRLSCPSGRVPVANKWGMTYITHIFSYDSVGAGYTDLLAGFPPYDLFPNSPPLAGDIVYFGAATAVADTGPFDNLVYDIAAQASHDVRYEYGSGPGAWTAMTVTDNTAFAVGLAEFWYDGLRTVHWTPSATWVPNTVNGVEAYWIRCYMVTPTAAASPVQQNYDVYTCNTPFWQVDADYLTGDLDTVFSQYVQALDYSHTAASVGIFNQLFAGARSLARGEDFRAYINLADEQNHASIAVSSAGATAFADWIPSPSGRCIQYTSPAAGNTATITVAITGSLGAEYQGKYRCLLRCYDDGDGAAGENFTASLTYGVGTIFTAFTTSARRVNVFNETTYVDFGVITLLPHETVLSYNDMTFYLRINLTALDTGDLYLTDLILIPVDECFYQMNPQRPTVWTGGDMPNYDVQVISDEYYRGNARSVVLDNTGELVVYGQNIANSRQHLPPNRASRVWMFFGQVTTAITEPTCRVRITNGVEATAVQRYRNLRGAG